MRKGWGCVFSYTSEEDRRRQEKFISSRYGFEKELLQARHPRRVDRLWEQAGPRAERLYRRKFSNRAELHVMNQLYDSWRQLRERLDDLEHSLSRVEYFESLEQESPDQGWGEVAKLWTEARLVYDVESVGERLLGLDRDMDRHETLVEDLLKPPEDPEDPDVFEMFEPAPPSNHRSLENEQVCTRVELRLPWQLGDDEYLHEKRLQYLARFIVQRKQDTLSFMDALENVRSGSIKECYDALGFPKPRRGAPTMPKRFHEMLWDVVKKRYAAREPGDECTQFMGWFARQMLERWESTAVDYEAIFTYHTPHQWDRDSMKLFYEVREGGPVESGDKRLLKGRLPELLRELVKDGFIDEKDIKPPLKECYPTEQDVHLLAHGQGDSKRALERRVELNFQAQRPTIGSSQGMKLLVSGDGSEQAMISTSDLRALEKVIDTEHVYQVLYSGKDCGFMMSQEQFPSGKQATGKIYRLTRVAEGAEPEGDVVNIQGNRFLVRGMGGFDYSGKVYDQLFDCNSDIVGAKSITVITDISVDEFERKYFRDFMAHAMLHRTTAMGPELMFDLLDTVDRMENIVGAGFWLGEMLSPRTFLSTFEFSGRFAFKVEMTRDWDIGSELPVIASTLVGYLNEAGVPFHHEVMLGEGGRAQVKRKTKQREFQAEHLGEVVTALQGNGLVRFLSYLITQQGKYHMKSFGEANDPCEVCGRNYMGGIISSPERGEQWCDGFYGENLHHLAHHPHSFRNKSGQLEKIYLAMKDAEDHEPVFIQYPGIMPEFNAFAKAYLEHVHEESEGYQFWEATCGGINAEEEELEDNPELRMLRDEEFAINSRCAEAESRMYAAAQVLQEKYDSLRGERLPEDTPMWKLRSFWGAQLMIFGMYQIEAPNQLAEFAGQELMEKPVRLFRN
jgi:hypothetical protein